MAEIHRKLSRSPLAQCLLPPSWRRTTNVDSIWDTFSKYAWMGDKIGAPIHAWQVKPDGTYNVIGRVRNYTNTGTQIKFDVPQAQQVRTV